MKNLLFLLLSATLIGCLPANTGEGCRKTARVKMKDPNRQCYKVCRPCGSKNCCNPQCCPAPYKPGQCCN